MHRSRILSRLLLPVAFVALLVCGANVGAASAASEVRNVGGITAVTLLTGGELHISVTGEESLTIEAEPHALPLLTSDVVGGRLTLGTVPFPPLVTFQPIVYNLTLKSLDDIENLGSGSITIDGLNAGHFRASLSGSSATIVRGNAASLDLTTSGSAGFSGQDFHTANAVVSVTGSGDAVLGVSDTLDATILGSGDIRYSGDPTVKTNVLGSGAVVRA